MSSENIKKVIARAVSDAGFRELLSRSPDEAFAGYDLTEEEKSAILAGLSREGFDALSSDLGDRVSRAGVHLDDFVGEIADMVSMDEAEATPITLPSPPSPEEEALHDDPGATPLPIPRPEGEVEATPINIPYPHPEDPDVAPSPTPHLEDEALLDEPDIVPPLPQPGAEADVPMSEMHPDEDELVLPGIPGDEPDDGVDDGVTPINIP